MSDSRSFSEDGYLRTCDKLYVTLSREGEYYESNHTLIKSKDKHEFRREFNNTRVNDRNG